MARKDSDQPPKPRQRARKPQEPVDKASNSKPDTKSNPAEKVTPPVLLLPVRLETRFVSSNSLLQIRVIPDVAHIDQHRIGLDKSETELGRSYWLQRLRAARTKEPVLGLYSELASKVGVTRAAWVARACQPTNWVLGSKPPENISWPKVKIVDAPHVSVAALMPRRWVARGHRQREPVAEAAGSDITKAIALAPDFATGVPDDGAVEFLKAHGLGWMVDFKEAITVGLGIELPVPVALRGVGFTELFVTGVPHRSSDSVRAIELERQLTALRYTSGFKFLRRGSSTNHTERDDAVLAAGPNAASYAAELEPAPRARTRPATARRFQTALGLAEGSVVERVDNAADGQLALADQLRMATWDALEGKLLDSFLGEEIPATQRTKIYNHAMAFHRPGGHLPAVQIADQPYGIHLVSDRMNSFAEPDKPTLANEIERYVSRVRPYWDSGIPSVPLMNPLATNTEGTGNDPISAEQYLADVTAVLANQPNPAQFWLRSAESRQSELAIRWLFLNALLDAGTSLLPIEKNRYVERSKDNLSELKGALERFDTDLRNANGTEGYTAEQRAQAVAARSLIVDKLMPGVLERELLAAPLQRMTLAWDPVTGLFNNDNPIILDLEFDEILAEWNSPIVAAEGQPATWVADYLREMVDAANNDSEATAPAQPAPLLWSVLDASIRRVSAARKARLLRSILAIAEHANDYPETAIDDLELLLRESVGGASTRLDSWYSSTAARRLADLTDKETGIAPAPYISGWGAVLHLSPNANARSHGFIPAPSLTHAATAAVLRSGYETLGDEGQTAPLAIDLSSDRARRAIWLLDGIRSGAAPGDIMGARLERRLQEAGLATVIDELRQAEAAAKDVAAVTVVDGVSVARSQVPGANLTPVEIALGKAINVAHAAAPQRGLLKVINKTVADLDAVSDVSIAHSVHSLVQGQEPVARAALASVTTGETVPPVPTMMHSQAVTTGVAHTVVLRAPSAAIKWPGAASSLRAIADPAAERLAAAVLGSPASIALEIVPSQGSDATVVLVPMTQLGVSALDFAIDATADGTVAGTVRTAALTAAGFDGSNDGGGWLTRMAADSLEYAVLASSLGTVLRAGRAQRATDLTPPELAGVAPAPDDSVKRRDDLRARLDRVFKTGGEVSKPIAKDASIPTLLKALRTAVRAELPFLTEAEIPEWLFDSAGNLISVVGPAGTGVTNWIGQAAAVRPEVRKLSELLDVVDAVAGSPQWVGSAAQTSPTQGWVADSAPERSPNHSYAIVGLDPLGTKITGLVVDGWTDSVPNAERSAAAAVHFDAPGAESPNLWLLGVKAQPGNWTTDALFSCIMNTILDAQRRMVGAQDLPELGQYLPATFLLSTTGSDQEKLP